MAMIKKVTYHLPEEELVQETTIQSRVYVSNRLTSTIELTRPVGAIGLGQVGRNIVQNAVVSETPPSNPYEGQVWIQVTL